MIVKEQLFLFFSFSLATPYSRPHWVLIASAAAKQKSSGLVSSLVLDYLYVANSMHPPAPVSAGERGGEVELPTKFSKRGALQDLNF